MAEEAEGGEVLMMETTIALALQEMLRPETGATARGAEVRAVGVPAGVVAEAQPAVLHPGEEEEVPEEVVEAVEATADAEAQAIAAMVRAAEAEAETADVEPLIRSSVESTTPPQMHHAPANLRRMELASLTKNVEVFAGSQVQNQIQSELGARDEDKITQLLLSQTYRLYHKTSKKTRSYNHGR